MVVLCICLGHYHVCDITLHSFTNQISIGHSLLIHRLVLPVLPHLLSEIATATVNGKSIISFWSYTYFNKVVSTSYGSNAVIEHVFCLLNALHKGRNAFLRNIHHAYLLWPLLASLLKPCLQMLVKFWMRIDRLLMNRHTKLYLLTNQPLNSRIILCIDRQICDGCWYRTTDVSSNMVGIHMVSKRYCKTDYDVLTLMNIRHNSDFSTLKHRAVHKLVHQR